MTSRFSLSTHPLRQCVTMFVALLIAMMLMPGTALAQSVLEIVDIDTKGAAPDGETPLTAPAVKIYFSARNADGTPISGLKADDITLTVDKEKPQLASKALKAFKEGESPVAVVVVFPVARDYIEEFFGIRTNVSTFLGQFRPIDFVGYVSYDSNARPSNMVTGADIGGLAGSILELENTDAIEPNMFGALVPAIGMLKNVENVKQKYLVLVSNAEGSVVGDDAAATQRIQAFQAAVKKHGIRPLIVGYTPDGEEELTYRKWLKMLSLAGGTYTEATELDQLPGAMAKVYDQIYQAYILEAEIDHSNPEEYWLGEGKYNWTVTAKIGSQELKSSQEAAWSPGEQPETPIWPWIVYPLIGLIVAAGLVFLILKIARRKKDEAPVMVEPGMPMPQQPQEFRCETCGKVIPEQLYNFRGEFCMSGAQPDCPYYQMPDHGRLTVAKGPLGDVTFFIKEEITTVGKDIGSSVALVDSSVSKKHAAIKVDEGNRYEIRDFGSTNGTFVNGEKIQRMFLKDGDKIMFGTVEVEFHLK